MSPLCQGEILPFILLLHFFESQSIEETIFEVNIPEIWRFYSVLPSMPEHIFICGIKVLAQSFTGLSRDSILVPPVQTGKCSRILCRNGYNHYFWPGSVQSWLNHAIYSHGIVWLGCFHAWGTYPESVLHLHWKILFLLSGLSLLSFTIRPLSLLQLQALLRSLSPSF